MIKATGKFLGRDTLFVGLADGNLNRFRDRPLDTYILIRGEEAGLSHNVLIFSGRTEADMVDLMRQGFAKDTKVIVSDRLKS